MLPVLVATKGRVGGVRHSLMSDSDADAAKMRESGGGGEGRRRRRRRRTKKSGSWEGGDDLAEKGRKVEKGEGQHGAKIRFALFVL